MAIKLFAKFNNIFIQHFKKKQKKNQNKWKHKQLLGAVFHVKASNVSWTTKKNNSYHVAPVLLVISSNSFPIFLKYKNKNKKSASRDPNFETSGLFDDGK